MKRALSVGALAACVLAAQPAYASAASEGAAIVPKVALALVLLLTAAKVGGELAVRIGQPAVLGELVIGVALGNLTLLGFSGLEPIESDVFVDLMAEIGVLVLLFEIGLESTVVQMLTVGVPALLVACLGVAAPFALGYGVGLWLLPEASPYVHAFLGAALCATSVGITARVLKDLGQSRTPEARIILGAAVFDDVLGLVVLAVVTGMIAAAGQGSKLAAGDIAWTAAKAIGFLVAALALGVFASPALFSAASRLRARGVLLALALAFCFLLSWMAAAIGLAPIVGAFAAGLILEEVHFRDFVSRGEKRLEELIEPISSFLVPIFFVLMGMRTDLASFAEPRVLPLAVGLTVAAIVGKQACALGVLGRNMDARSIGIGMIPRGEVGLIFANIGLTITIGGAPVLSRATFSALVVMVIFTTVVTPPALRWSLARARVREEQR